jgi:hypothetical protein
VKVTLVPARCGEVLSVVIAANVIAGHGSKTIVVVRVSELAPLPALFTLTLISNVPA